MLRAAIIAVFSSVLTADIVNPEWNVITDQQLQLIGLTQTYSQQALHHQNKNDENDVALHRYLKDQERKY